jgi:hypothetical protein
MDSEEWRLSGSATEGVASNAVGYNNKVHFHVSGDVEILINSTHNHFIRQRSLFGVT